MGVASCCGAGLLFTLALISCRQSLLNLLVQRYAFTLPHISMPLGEQRIDQMKVGHGSDPETNKKHATLKRSRGVGKENACHGDNIPPKRGRKNKSIDSKHRCGSCMYCLATNW